MGGGKGAESAKDYPCARNSKEAKGAKAKAYKEAKAEAEQMFMQLGKDIHPTVTAEEFREAGMEFTDEEFKSVDKDGDGAIDIEEATQFILTLPKMVWVNHYNDKKGYYS